MANFVKYVQHAFVSLNTFELIHLKSRHCNLFAVFHAIIKQSKTSRNAGYCHDRRKRRESTACRSASYVPLCLQQLPTTY